MLVVRTKNTLEEARIAKAIRALDNGECKSVSEAYKAFNVLYKKLLGRYHHGSKASHGGQNKALDAAQEEALLQYIDQCDQLSRPLKRWHIELAANSILWSNGQFKEVSHNWITRFDLLTTLI
jgi:Tc5 transposase DNA-binding domain